MLSSDQLVEKAFRVIDEAVLADQMGESFDIGEEVPWEQVHRALYDSGMHKAIEEHLLEYPEGSLKLFIKQMTDVLGDPEGSHLTSIEARKKMYSQAFGIERW